MGTVFSNTLLRAWSPTQDGAERPA